MNVIKQNLSNELMKNSKLTITTKELSEILGVGMNTVYMLINRDDFPKITIGNKHLIVKEKIPYWLENNIGCNL